MEVFLVKWKFSYFEFPFEMRKKNTKNIYIYIYLKRTLHDQYLNFLFATLNTGDDIVFRLLLPSSFEIYPYLPQMVITLRGKL